MTTNENYMKKLKNSHNGSFPELPDSTRELISEMLQDTINQTEGYNEIKPEEIEFQSRDGFIPHSFNRGGLRFRQFTDLASMGSGYNVSHVKARAEIESQIEYGLRCARESFFEKHETKLKSIGVETAEAIDYWKLTNASHSDLAEEFSEHEFENLSNDSIMFEVRFMYHGTDDKGLHSASVSCAVNTEGPYHRTHISWAPNVFCEGAKEVEISWRTEGGLKRQLKNALKKTSSEVF